MRHSAQCEEIKQAELESVLHLKLVGILGKSPLVGDVARTEWEAGIGSYVGTEEASSSKTSVGHIFLQWARE